LFSPFESNTDLTKDNLKSSNLKSEKGTVKEEDEKEALEES